MLGVTEDYTLEVGEQLLLTLARQFAHILHIHHSSLTHRECKSFACRVHSVNRDLRLDGALGEHIRLCFEFLIFIKYLKRTKEKVGVIVAEHHRVSSAVDKSVLGGKLIILFIEFRLEFFDLALGVILKLRFDQSLHRVSDTDHTLDTVLTRYRSLHGVHHAVLSVVNLSVYNRKGKVLHGRVCGNGFILCSLCQFVKLYLADLCVDIADCFCQKLSEIFVLIRLAGGFGSIGTGTHHYLTEHHIGVVDKVLVHLDSVFIGSKVYPILVSLDNSISLLEEDNIRHDLVRACSVKGIVGQTDSTEEVGSLRDILSDRRVLFVKSTRACDESDHTTGANLIQGFRKEIVVNEEVVLVVLLVKELEIIERHVTDCHIKEAIGEMSFLISVDGDTVLLIELPCNSTRKAIKLNTVHLGIHTLGNKTHKVTDTA